MAKKEKIRLAVPKDEVEANALICLIESNQKLIQSIEQEYAEATKRYKWRIRSVQATILKRLLELYVFYQRNRKDLTAGKRKIATLLSGKIGTYSASLPEVEAKKPRQVILLIKARGAKFVERFLREKTIVSLDKDAMRKFSKQLLADPEIAKLVRVIKKEYFKVEPVGGKLVSEDVSKLEKMI